MKLLSDEVESLKNKLLNKQYKKAKLAYQSNDPYDNVYNDGNFFFY